MRSRNRLKSNGDERFSVAMTDLSWASVGFPPSDRIKIPSSDGAIFPSPSVSKSMKASFIEDTWSSLKPSLPIFRFLRVFGSDLSESLSTTNSYFLLYAFLVLKLRWRD
ncbi:hypothetical protein EUTSA_v10023769mg [Eutrema salsugineum]|uniref:Uncharacterized protein n=1 Tax=Eutrema salsugineum TaxID=72664 RepID=V4KP34_EUTSA|nr:hypothetical protein EUTSA_v10023769mg [Eutrema salsugineum]